MVAGHEVQHRDWAPIYHGDVIKVGFSSLCFVLEERLLPVAEKQRESYYEPNDEEEHYGQNDQSTRSLTWDEVLKKINEMLDGMDHRESIRNKKTTNDNRRTELATESDTETESDSSSEDDKSSPSPKTPMNKVPKEYKSESEDETSSESENDSSTDSSSDEEIEVPRRGCANPNALKPSERARIKISEKGILGAPPSAIPNSSTSITSKDTKGILGPAKAFSAIRPLEWVQPRTTNENQGPDQQNESARRRDTKHSMGILTRAESRATPLEGQTPEASPKERLRQSKEEIFTIASPFRWADEPWNLEPREQTEMKTMEQPATGSKGLLPPPSIQNQPKEGGMDHDFLESPNKNARMKLQQGATQELARQNAKLDRAQDERLPLVKRQAGKEFEEELLAKTDGMFPESEEENEDLPEERHDFKVTEIGAAGDQYTVTTFASSQRQIHSG
ncbi:uncharacterized protein LOC116257123 [Nymphaea colorata]|uniref:uncharacterized protein LOC116257123 n=1 Tax=Nymphaea colorata TaxID=210225 RepID=UPI00129E78E5|nr:uncharacterized protein LOC116257123 [Nymphaea colorata]